MSSEPPIVQLRLCPYCGAACTVTQPACWMCDGPLPPVPAERRLRPSPESSKFDGISYVLLALCVGLSLLIGLGLAAQDPGALIPFAIIVAPAFAVTGVRALWQVQSTGQPQPGKLVVSFVVSILTTIAVIVILAAAAVVLLFVICLQAISGNT